MTLVPRKQWFADHRQPFANSSPEGREFLLRQPLTYVSHEGRRLLLQSNFCFANASRNPSRGPFVSIDHIGPRVTTATDTNVFVRELVHFYHKVSDNHHVFWLSKTVFFARILALLLGLGSDSSDALGNLLFEDRADAPPVPGTEAWKRASHLRDVIAEAIKGKTWFRARLPGCAVFFCGIANCSVQLGDQFLVDTNLTFLTDEHTTIPGIVLRRTSNVYGILDASSAPNSFRSIGGASLSWPITERVDLDEGTNPQLRPSGHIRMKDVLWAKYGTTLHETVQFWLE